MLKKNIAAYATLALTFSHLAVADPASDRDLLLACDRANGTCQGALAAKDTLIRLQDEQLSLLIKENSALRDRGHGIMDQPFFYFLLGMGVTALTVNLVKP